MNALPAWQDNWQQPDPMSGQQGWEVRDYINLVVAIALIVSAVGYLCPALLKVREADARAQVINKMRERDMEMLQQPPWPLPPKP